MGKKVLFFDIDGTLLPNGADFLPEDTLQALIEARKNGHLTFINTGRVWSALPAHIRELPLSGFLCGCGTSVHFGREHLMHYSVPPERCDEIVNLIFQSKGVCVLEAEEDVYLADPDPRFPSVDALGRYYRSFGVGCQGSANEGGHQFDKFCFLSAPDTGLNKILENLEEDMDVIFRNEKLDGRLFEVVPKGYSKATAVKYVMDHFNIAFEDTYCFGDSANDLTMFQACCHNVAMEVHDPVLEALSEYITGPSEKGGISRAMKHYGLISSGGRS